MEELLACPCPGHQQQRRAWPGRRCCTCRNCLRCLSCSPSRSFSSSSLSSSWSCLFASSSCPSRCGCRRMKRRSGRNTTRSGKRPRSGRRSGKSSCSYCLRLSSCSSSASSLLAVRQAFPLWPCRSGLDLAVVPASFGPRQNLGVPASLGPGGRATVLRQD